MNLKSIFVFSLFVGFVLFSVDGISSTQNPVEQDFIFSVKKKLEAPTISPNEAYNDILSLDLIGNQYAFRPYTSSPLQSDTARFEGMPLAFTETTKDSITVVWKIKGYNKPNLVGTFFLKFQYSIISKDSQIPTRKISKPLDAERYEDQKRFVNRLGYNPDTREFSSQTFSTWFLKSYFGFTKNNPGFDPETNRPAAYNISYKKELQYLDLSKDYLSDLGISSQSFMTTNPMNNPQAWVEEIYHNIQKTTGKAENVYLSSDKHTITINMKDGLQDLINLDNNTYVTSHKEMFYTHQANTSSNHPSLIKGKYVWCAGHISTDSNAKITFLSNGSGHYTPTPYHLYTLVKYLAKRNQFSENAKIEIHKKDTTYYLLPVQDFLNQNNENFLKEKWEETIQQKIANDSFLKTFI